MHPGLTIIMIGRGIEGISIFRRDEDREDFLTRLGALSKGEALSAHARALLDNRLRPQVNSFISRLLKNAHLLRFPHPSPCQARGRLVAA
jgi:hypothetical protein